VVTLSWSVCLLLLLQCIAGMMLSQLVQDFILDPDKDLEERHNVFSYYGTFTRSQITMFEVHLANFGPACRILLDNCGEWYAGVFLAYRCLAGFAVLNVINAVFIQQTITVAQRDHDVMIQQKEKAVKAYAKDLHALFAKLDTSEDGFLSLEELKGIQSQPELLLWMSALEIDTNDLEGLFHLLDGNGDERVTVNELLQAAPRIKGNAKSIDMLSVLTTLWQMNDMIESLIKLNGLQTPQRVSSKQLHDP